jgi:DNA-binding transcriptional LysR family regulator
MVPRVIAAFREKQPQIGVTLQVRSSAIVRDLVAFGRYDLGIASDEVDFSGVDHQHFADYRMVAVLPPGHRFARRATITADDLL